MQTGYSCLPDFGGTLFLSCTVSPSQNFSATSHKLLHVIRRNSIGTKMYV